MKKYFIAFLVVFLIGVITMTIFKPRVNSSPYASEQNALEDLSGWYEDSPDRTWTFVSANAGGNMFTVYVSGDVTNVFRVAMRLRAKQGGDYQYFIIHDVSAYDGGNDRTTVLLFGGTDYDIADAVITDVAFSKERFPAGFPVSEDKWVVEVVNTSTNEIDPPAVDTWYDIESIDLPVGLWSVSYRGYGSGQISAGQYSWGMYSTLSTGAATESNTETTDIFGYGTASTLLLTGKILGGSGYFDIQTEQPLYLNIKTSVTVDAIGMYGLIKPIVIRAVSGYY